MSDSQNFLPNLAKYLLFFNNLFSQNAKANNFLGSSGNLIDFSEEKRAVWST
jgi:hypothetical protein